MTFLEEISIWRSCLPAPRRPQHKRKRREKFWTGAEPCIYIFLPLRTSVLLGLRRSGSYIVGFTSDSRWITVLAFWVLQLVGPRVPCLNNKNQFLQLLCQPHAIYLHPQLCHLCTSRSVSLWRTLANTVLRRILKSDFNISKIHEQWFFFFSPEASHKIPNSYSGSRCISSQYISH